MKGTTLLLLVGLVGYLMYLRGEEKKAAADTTSSSSGSTSGTGGAKTLGDFVDEFANLLNGVTKAVAGSGGSDATNAPHASSGVSV